MDIHRCRFVDYNPSAINALAFSHPLPRNPQSSRIPPSLRLAIGRANGSIEIWNPQQHWLQETILHGGLNRSVEGLVWTQEEHHSVPGSTLGRLFSIGYSTLVTEWDLTTGKPLAHFDCNKGVIWSIAAQPRNESEGADGGEASQLVVGCEDGSLVLISTEGGPGSMNLVRVLAQSRNSRVLSVAYQTPHLVVAGMADSKLRVFDTRSGRVTATMSVGQNAGQKDVHVWRVKCLPGIGNWIVAGDSRGEITFWDGKRYTLRQRLKAHDADIMALETNSKGTHVFSSGVDRKMVKYELSSLKTTKMWAEVSIQRFHKHDVLAMASYEAGNMSVIVSGGVDMTPIIIPLRQWGQEYHRTLPAAPQMPVVTSAPVARLVVAHMEREVKIWRIENLDTIHLEDEIFGGDDDERGRRLVGRVVLNGDENIAASAISEDGSLLAVSTITSTKLFHLRPRKSLAHQLRVSKLPLNTKLTSAGARALHFTPDGRWLCCITPNSRVQLLHIHPLHVLGQPPSFELPDTALALHRNDREGFAISKKNALRNGVVGLGRDYGHQIHTVAVSANGRLLAVSDLGGWIDAWERDESETWRPLSSKLPRLSSPAVTIGFRPSNATPQPSTSAQLAVEDTIIELDESPPSTSRETSLQLLHAQHQQLIDTTSDSHHGLFVLTSAHTLHEFDLYEGTLTAWSKRNPSENLPQAFIKVRDRASGMAFTRQERSGVKLWVWGSNWVSMFDIERDLLPPASSTTVANEDGAKVSHKKRKRGGEVVVMTSGAGGQIPAGSRGALPTTAVKRTNAKQQLQLFGRDAKLVSLVSADFAMPEDEDDEDEDEEDEDMETFLIDNARSRRAAPQPHNARALTNGDAMDVDGQAASKAHPHGASSSSKHIFKYRPLLAFLPIGKMDERLEMVVVERPLTDVALPPRFADKRDMGRVI